MNRAVVFDLYDTLVSIEGMDFFKGLELLYEGYMADACTLDQVKEYNEISFQKYIERHKEEKEYPLMTEEIPDYLAHFGVNRTVDDPGFEFDFMNRCSKFAVADGVKELLEELCSRGVYMYVLSNSIYSTDCARKLLASLGILHYFREVFSSADYGISKPAEEFFNVAVSAVQRDIPGIEQKDIVFVGDRIDLDAAGACRAGLRGVWLNHKGAENELCLPVRVISDIREVTGIVFPGPICCIGDSLTEGDWGIIPGIFKPNVHDVNYPWFLSRMTGAEVKNFGRCGWKTSNILQWYREGGFSVAGADKIIILLGTNGGHDPDEDTPDNRAYAELIGLLRQEAPRAVIYVCTPPNATKVPGKFFYGYAPHVLKSVLFVRKLAKELSLPLIDLAASPRITPETEDELQPNDGLHFAEKGYRVLAEEVLRSL
ncbi:MAG: hypothetical protein CW338_11855 [Clostridiales bacterium]|nr:hypothetical protein [Clostridiales bacterium]